MKLPWPRFRRLTKRAQFTACYDRGARHYTRYFVVFARQAEADEPAQSTAGLIEAASPVGISDGSCCLGNASFFCGKEPLARLCTQSGTQTIQPCGRLGLAVTKKCGNAVQRNRIKRVLRAFFRLHQHEMPAMDIVVTPKRHLRADQIHLALVERDLVPLLANLRKSLSESLTLSQAALNPVLVPASAGNHGEAFATKPRDIQKLDAPTQGLASAHGSDLKPSLLSHAAPAATCASLNNLPVCGGPA